MRYASTYTALDMIASAPTRTGGRWDDRAQMADRGDGLEVTPMLTQDQNTTRPGAPLPRDDGSRHALSGGTSFRTCSCGAAAARQPQGQNHDP